jgi:anti-anti-sigma factor
MTSTQSLPEHRSPAATTEAGDPITAVPDDPALRVRVTHPRRGAIVVNVAGEVDCASAPLLRAVLMPRLGTAAHTIVVDLSETGFFSSAGMSLLVEADARARTSGQLFRVVATGHAVRRALRITELDTVVHCHDSLLEALDAVSDQEACSHRSASTLRSSSRRRAAASS